MNTQSTTATEILERHRRDRRQYAIDSLLRALQQYMCAYPQDADDEMPLHDLAWVSELNGEGPENLITSAIECHPEIWAGALPESVVIVPKSALKGLGVHGEMVDHLAAIGANLVHDYAARREHAKRNGERFDNQAS